jgi:membrane protease YdiL (CAAX protease family)
MIGVPETILHFLLIMIPVASFLGWRQAWLQRRAGNSILAAECRDAVPWGFVDLLLILVMVMTVVGMGSNVGRWAAEIPLETKLEELPPGQQSVVFAAFGVSTLFATLFSLAYLRLRWTRAVWHHGFSSARLGDDIMLGARWFAMLAVPVLVVQLALVQWVPTKHPLIEMLRESGDTTFLPVAAFSAIIAAPIFEEVFFRLILQGWLEKVMSAFRRTSPRGNVDRHVSFEGDTPPNAAESAVDDLDPAPSVSWIPILVSSSLFSLAHVGHGPDWLPLFFLALGLGYLYQRTGRIQSCIVVHVLLNALGVIQLWAAVRQQ